MKSMKMRLIALLCIVLTAGSGQAAGEDSQIDFNVKPSRCIALHRGQTCYQKLKFRWQTPPHGAYCLVRLPDGTPLTCWQGMSQTSFEHEFRSDSSIIYEVRVKNQSRRLAAVKITVAWVYRTSRKSASGWRLF